MQQVQLIGLTLLLISSVAAGFGLQPLKKTVVGALPKLEGLSSDSLRQSALVGTLSLVPTQSAMAADGSALGAVSIPLLVSLLIMVPFLYYQQALKPKERSVKQIELDDNLRAKDSKGLFGKTLGKTGEARAGKRK